jgi:hypothetical protein
MDTQIKVKETSVKIEEKASDFVEGFAIGAEQVNVLQDKSFEIVEKPRYELKSDLDDPSKTKKKLIMKIKLSDGSISDYCPNKTSQKVVIAKKGMKLDNWVGFKGKFKVVEQMISGKMLKVIYIE